MKQTGIKTFLAVMAVVVTGMMFLPVAFADTATTNVPSDTATTNVGQNLSITIPNPLSCDDVVCIWKKLYNLVWTLSFPIVTLMILYGAFQIMSAGGQPEKFKAGVSTIKYAVIGLVVVLIASAIPYLIENILTGK